MHTQPAPISVYTCVVLISENQDEIPGFNISTGIHNVQKHIEDKKYHFTIVKKPIWAAYHKRTASDLGSSFLHRVQPSSMNLSGQKRGIFTVEAADITVVLPSSTDSPN